MYTLVAKFCKKKKKRTKWVYFIIGHTRSVYFTNHRISNKCNKELFLRSASGFLSGIVSAKLTLRCRI